MIVPTNIPKNTFYYHYKHDASVSFNHYAYEVLGVGYHTEDDCRPEDINMVVYRPLYESSVYTAGKFFDIRPLEMWMGTVELDGKTVSRFTEITDQEIVEKLKELQKQMYS